MNTDGISNFFHCAMCVEDGLRPNIGLGVTITGKHLILVCETHELTLAKFELKNPMAPAPCAMCGKVGAHSH